jgi:hypothetical protein
MRKLIFCLLLGCTSISENTPSTVPSTNTGLRPVKQFADYSWCSLQTTVITNLAGQCYLEIQKGCIKDNDKGRQAGECTICDALDSAQEKYNKQCDK